MDDREFFDSLYQQWAATTGAEDRFWAVQENHVFPGTFQVVAVGEDDSRFQVADFVPAGDAEFIAFAHGFLPQIVRRVHEALDEADRLDAEKDDLHARIADLELEVTVLRKGGA